MNDTKTIRVAELFAGIGGFRLGLENANTSYKQIETNYSAQYSNGIEKRSQPQLPGGFRIVWANEWDRHACQIYRKNFGEKELVEGDITKISTKDIPDFDMLVGGFPCQAFSLAGKRQGFKDIRGTLFFEIARIAEAKRPKILLLENVKGLLSHDNGDTFETILRTLGNLGYWYEYQVLNSKYFGVPQNRERVFIVGHLRGSGSREVFPVCEGSGVSCAEDSGELGDESGICSTIDARYGALRNSGETYLIYQHPRNINRQALYQTTECVQALRTVQRKPNQKIVAQALQTDGFLRAGSSFGTNKPQSARNIRRLTPTECERLQGFPDGWTSGVSDTQRYKCLGNAVTVNVIEYLGRQLLACLSQKEQR